MKDIITLAIAFKLNAEETQELINVAFSAFQFYKIIIERLNQQTQKKYLLLRFVNGCKSLVQKKERIFVLWFFYPLSMQAFCRDRSATTSTAAYAVELTPYYPK